MSGNFFFTFFPRHKKSFVTIFQQDFKSGQVRSGQRSGQVRSGQVRSGQLGSKVRSGERSGQVRSKVKGQVKGHSQVKGQVDGQVRWNEKYLIISNNQRLSPLKFSETEKMHHYQTMST